MQRFKDLWPGVGVVAGSRLDVSLVSGSVLTLISGVAGLLAGLKLTSTQNSNPNYPPVAILYKHLLHDSDTILYPKLESNLSCLKATHSRTLQ